MTKLVINTVTEATALLRPAYFEYAINTSGSPSCWTDYEPQRYNGAYLPQVVEEILHKLEDDALYNERFGHGDNRRDNRVHLVLYF